MQPRIENREGSRLVGRRVVMSFINDRTAELWGTFAPRIKEISNRHGEELYSVDIYNDPGFFTSFNPAREFEKWAAVAAYEYLSVPEGMELLLIPPGKYAVFSYRGRASEAAGLIRWIHADWLPGSGYELDDRPFLAIMGHRYTGEDPASEEEFWLPVKEVNAHHV